MALTKAVILQIICPRIGEGMLLPPQKGRKENAEVMCKAEKKDTGIARNSRFSLLLDLHNSQHACERQSLCYRLQSFLKSHEIAFLHTFLGSVSPAFFLKVCCI